jgi:hypothetical protein
LSFKSWLREPLLHFIILGGLIFGIDHVIAARKPNAQVISISPDVEKDARAIFRSAQGRDPTPSEMNILRDRWVDNEVLYREGLAMRLDAGDPTVRERVIFKALNVIQSNITVPTVDEKTLRAWFEKNRDRYDEPARVDFLEAVPTAGTSEEVARQFVVALNSGAQSDMKSSVRIFKGRPLNTIVQSFGADFANALEKLPTGQWNALPSKEGIRIVQVQRREAGESVDFNAVQGTVQRDWRDAKEQELLAAAIHDLEKKYTIQRTGKTL